MKFDFDSVTLHNLMRQSKDFRECFITHTEGLESDLQNVQESANEYRLLHERRRDERDAAEKRVSELCADVRRLEATIRDLNARLVGYGNPSGIHTEAPYYGMTEDERHGCISAMYRAGRENKIAQIKDVRQYIHDAREVGKRTGAYGIGLAEAKAFVENDANRRAAFGLI